MAHKPLTPPLLLVEDANASSNLLYATGFHAVDPVVLLDEGTTRTLVVPALEAGRAANCRGVTVVVTDALKLTAEQKRSLSGWAIALLKRKGLREVRVPWYAPAGLVDRLRQSRIKTTIVNGEVYPERAVKTRSEIRAIETSQLATIAAMKIAIGMIRRAEIRPSGGLALEGKALTSERVREAIQIALLGRRCIGREIIVAGGRQAADPHERGSGPLRAGETIVLDIFPRHEETGYWGDCTRTVVRGRATPHQKRMVRAVKQAQQLALGAIRAGIKGSEVHGRVVRFFEEAGFPVTVDGTVIRGFFHGTGHGIGLDIHEKPSVSLADTVLERNAVVTVEPGLYDPDHGGVRIEDVAVVQARGCRVLGSCPRTFELTG